MSSAPQLAFTQVSKPTFYKQRDNQLFPSWSFRHAGQLPSDGSGALGMHRAGAGLACRAVHPKRQCLEPVCLLAPPFAKSANALP